MTTRYEQVQASARARLRQMIVERHTIRDDDFNGTNYTMRGDAVILGQMARAGYTIGLDENDRNIWYPPDDGGPDAER